MAMTKGWESGTKGAIAVVLVVVAFFGANIAADTVLRRSRVDLTESGLYTLSDGTRRILTSISRPVNLTFYYSESVARGKPGVQEYGKRVAEMIEEFRLRSGGKINVETFEPEAFSAAEDRAQKDGVQGIPVSADEVFYLGLVGSNDTDGREIIPFFDPGQERFLEFELARVVSMLDHPKRKKVFVVSGLPIQGVEPYQGMDPALARPWMFLRELALNFDVTMPPPDFRKVDDDTDLLLVIHPKGFNENQIRVLEDFILKGRPTIVCIDPFSDSDQPLDTSDPMATMTYDRSSNLDTLLVPWGLTMAPGKVVADMELARRAPDPHGRGDIPYLQHLTLTSANLNADEPMTRGVGIVNISSVGSLTHDPSKGTTFTPVLTSSQRSNLVETSRKDLMMDPSALVAQFQSGDTRQVLGGILRGNAAHVLTGATDPNSTGKAAPTDINLLVIADTDFLNDAWWMQEVPLMSGQVTVQKMANNIDLISNAIDAMCGSPDLLAVRARGTFARPFTKVEAIRREAEQKFLARAKELEAKAQETDKRLAELLRSGGSDPSGKTLSPAVRAELAKFEDERMATRAELREVRYNLDKDVKALGRRVQWINIAATPTLVAVGALALGAYRGARRRADRASMAGRD